jgi:hypothetical protein
LGAGNATARGNSGYVAFNSGLKLHFEFSDMLRAAAANGMYLIHTLKVKGNKKGKVVPVLN